MIAAKPGVEGCFRFIATRSRMRWRQSAVPQSSATAARTCRRCTRHTRWAPVYFPEWCRHHGGRREMQPQMALALAPVSWLTALMRDGENCHGMAQYLVKDRVGKVTKNMTPDRILVFGPHQRVDAKPINRLKRLGSKILGRYRAALEVPKEGLSDFCLCLGQNFDFEAGHRALSRALASAQETALIVPARRAACRALISCRHASVIEESALPSRLSSSATVNAERSSGGNPRASSRMWFTWAFMHRSLALKLGSVTVLPRRPTLRCRGLRDKAASGHVTAKLPHLR